MILKNQAKILSILSLPECADFFDGKPPKLDDRILYIYKDGCLFPSVMKEGYLSAHAAIPRERRGLIGIRAGKQALQWVLDNLCAKVVVHVYRYRRHANMYARLLGMSYTHSDDKYNYYEVSK